MLSVIVSYKKSNNHQVSYEVSLTFTKMVFQQLRELVQPSKPNRGSNLEILDSISSNEKTFKHLLKELQTGILYIKPIPSQ